MTPSPIIVHQPRPFDIVGNPIRVSGLSNSFEATIVVLVRDQNKTQLFKQAFTTGGFGSLQDFQIQVPLQQVPKTTAGTLEVIVPPVADDAKPISVIVPVIFGTALVNPYQGFIQYVVKPGDSLSLIAQQFYKKTALANRIFEANRNQLTNPNQIIPGQVLRVPFDPPAI